MRQVILTADDFGLAVPVNAAVERAHRDGVLSCASLMVGAEAADDAVARARRLPGLRVGLHVVLVEGRPVSPPERVPDLVDASGAFRDGLLSAGFRFFFRPGIRRQLEIEIEAQFAAFRATGLAFDHVNAHNHLHLHPTVLGLIVKVGRRYGLPAMRVPYEPPLPAARAAGGGLPGRLLASAGLGPWTALLRARLRRAGVRTNDFVFGLSDTGAMTEELVLKQIAGLPEGVSELYFHPATGRAPAYDRYMAAYRPEDELAALVSPRVRRALEDSGLRPVGFADLD